MKLCRTFGAKATIHRVSYVTGVTLPVTPNLAAALVSIRYKRKAKTLWIDTICIDQGDIPE